MKKQEFDSLKQKTKEELIELVVKKEQEVVKTQDDMFRGRVKNIRTVKILKDDIARLKTLITEKEARGIQK